MNSTISQTRFELKPHFVITPDYDRGAVRAEEKMVIKLIGKHLYDCDGREANASKWGMAVTSTEKKAKEYYERLPNKEDFKYFLADSRLIEEAATFYSQHGLECTEINRDAVANKFVLLYRKS